MHNCDGCYYEDRPPQEACNICRRDDTGEMTGWTSRDQQGCDEATGVVTIPQSAAPTAPFAQGGLDRATAEVMDMEQDADWNDEYSREEGLLKLLEMKNKVLSELRERAAMQELLIQEQRVQIDAWREEIEALRGEREDLRARLEKAEEEADFLRKQVEWQNHEQAVLEAKLEMVYLIFGGMRHAD